MKYYNGTRTHLSLEKDAPVSRAVDRAGHILCRPILGGLHHQYARIQFTTGTGLKGPLAGTFSADSWRPGSCSRKLPREIWCSWRAITAALASAGNATRI
jgi:hypothetical protein